MWKASEESLEIKILFNKLDELITIAKFYNFNDVSRLI